MGGRFGLITFVAAAAIAVSPAAAQDDEMEILLGGAVATAGVGAISALLQGGRQPHWVDVQALDVAGVRLGMTLDEATAGLASKGFTARNTGRQDSWQTRLAERAQSRGVTLQPQPSVPMTTTADGPDGQTVEIWYAPVPAGAVVSSVKYRAPIDRMTQDAFAAGVNARYGRATVGEPWRVAYCSRGDRSCSAAQTAVMDQASMTANARRNGFFYELDLVEGQGDRERRRVAFAAAVDAAAPQNARPAF